MISLLLYKLQSFSYFKKDTAKKNVIFELSSIIQNQYSITIIIFNIMNELDKDYFINQK